MIMPILERGDIYFLQRVAIPTIRGEEEVILDKFTLILQSGRMFLKAKEVDVVFGTTSKKRMVKNFPTDVIIKKGESDLPRKTKFICSKVYLIPKDHFYGLTKYCTLCEGIMAKIDKVLIEGLCINLESIRKMLELKYEN